MSFNFTVNCFYFNWAVTGIQLVFYKREVKSNKVANTIVMITYFFKFFLIVLLYKTSL